MLKLIASLLFFMCHFIANAQEKSLLDQISSNTNQTEKITGAFKSTRVINAHSTEMLGKANLDVRILHRFGMVNQGIDQLFGLDQASMRMGADYGITDNIMVGFGRSTFRKELDVFSKIRILQQATGSKPVPVTLLATIGGTTWTEKSFDPVKPDFGDRSAVYLQVIVGRKFSQVFSLQFSPIVVHSGRPNNPGEDQTIVGIGGGGRLKFSKRTALTFDYHRPIGNLSSFNRSPLSLGVDIETGGHVFQLHFSNAVGMNERAYMTQTTSEFFKGDIRFGFNLSRLFYVGKRKKLP